jgi:hypothetical protein
MRDADEAHSNDEADEARCKLNTLIEEKGYRTTESAFHPSERGSIRRETRWKSRADAGLQMLNQAETMVDGRRLRSRQNGESRG